MKTISALSIDCSIVHQPILILLNKWTMDKNYNSNLFTCKYDAIIPNQKFSVLPIYEAKYFFGTIIVWDTSCLQLCIDFPNIDKILYLQNDQIPWITNNNIPYNTWSKLFDDPRVNIVCPYKDIIDIFNLTWNKGFLIESLEDEKIHEYL